MTPASVNVPVGSRFSCGLLNYIVTEKIKAGEYQLQCETSGSEANGNIGQLIPINYISGLETAQITELLVPGEDEEGLESTEKDIWPVSMRKHSVETKRIISRSVMQFRAWVRSG